MTTTVIYIKDAPEGWQNNPKYAYIGRAGKGLYGTWGNPYPMNRTRTREESLDEYAYFLNSQSPGYLKAMRQSLKDRILVCFCKPLDCHGDIIVELVDKYYEGV